MHIQFCQIEDIRKEDPSLFINDVRYASSIKSIINSLPKLNAFRFVCRYSNDKINIDNMLKDIGTKAYVEIVSKLISRGMSAWLFVAHGAWQPDNRIVRHNRLWKRLERDYDLTSKEISNEIEFVSESGIRYALSCKLNESTFVAGLRVLQNRSSAIFLSKRDDMASDHSVRQFFSEAFPLRSGLSHYLISWAALLSGYCPNGEIVVGPIGGFDEWEHPLYIVGLPNQLASLPPNHGEPAE